MAFSAHFYIFYSLVDKKLLLANVVFSLFDGTIPSEEILMIDRAT